MRMRLKDRHKATERICPFCGVSRWVRADRQWQSCADCKGLAQAVHGHVLGGKPTRTYQAWSNMHSRCGNPKSPLWHWYGGRGIAVCERWSSFEMFLADLGEAPPGLWLERIDNDKGYLPSNCKWATPKEQAHNRRRPSANAIVTI